MNRQAVTVTESADLNLETPEANRFPDSQIASVDSATSVHFARRPGVEARLLFPGWGPKLWE